MARISDDLLIDILSRLPVKSLMRFKCVSKRWCSLISDPQFAKTQLQWATQGNATSSQRIIKDGVLQTINYEALDDGEEDGGVVELHTLGKAPSQWLGLVGHFDGLVCLVCAGEYILYNPTTRQSRIIANSSLVKQNHIFHGFGYDPRTDDYKILRGAYDTSADDPQEAMMEIFTLKSNSWRRIKDSHAKGPHGQGICLSGARHWLGFLEIGLERVPTIVSFNLAEEKFKELLQLPNVDPDTGFEGIGVIRSCLFAYRSIYSGHFKAWTMTTWKEGILGRTI